MMHIINGKNMYIHSYWSFILKYMYLCYSSTICSTCMHLYGHKNQPQIYSFIYDVPQEEEGDGINIKKQNITTRMSKHYPICFNITLVTLI